MAIRARCRRWAGGLYAAVFLLRAYRGNGMGETIRLHVYLCAVRSGNYGHFYPGTGKVPDGLEGGYL